MIRASGGTITTVFFAAESQPGYLRGLDASDFVLASSEMIIDGATCLEDIRLFENVKAYKEMAEVRHYPSSDGVGDWLRRHGGTDIEDRLWTVSSSLTSNTVTLHHKCRSPLSSTTASWTVYRGVEGRNKDSPRPRSKH